MDERQEKKRFKKLSLLERNRKLRLDGFVQEAMKTSQGREFMYWLLEIGKIGRNPFTANALITSFQCGELNVGQQIQAYLQEISPKDYSHMLEEKAKEQEDDRRDLDNDGNDGEAGDDN